MAEAVTGTTATTSGEPSTSSNRMDPFGPGSVADETRQAEFQQANDVPTDVNMNAVVARSQALTVDLAGKSFTGNMDRRDKLADIIMAKMGMEGTTK